MNKIRIISTNQFFPLKDALDFKPGQEVLVEIDQIIEPAIICGGQCPVKEEEEDETVKLKILRLLNEEDLILKKDLREKARKYLSEAKDKVRRHNLDMKILDADLSFDEKKLTIYFSAESRVDFRALVSDMVGSFHKIIRLQQVGPRDEAKFFGGFGKCGRQLCCAQFLNNLETITLEMAQIQEIASASPSKLSGCCGKLMCCLSYEADLYQKIKSKMPKIGVNLKTAQGEGKVIGHNVIENKVVLETDKGQRFEVVP